MSEQLKAEHQLPEGKLIETAMKAKGLSARKAASLAGISDGRWNQIMNGYSSKRVGQILSEVGPDVTLARMARVVDVSANQLREVGRPDAADALLRLVGMEDEADWQNVGTALDRLINIREQLNSVIDELSKGGTVG